MEKFKNKNTFLNTKCKNKKHKKDIKLFYYNISKYKNRIYNNVMITLANNILQRKFNKILKSVIINIITGQNEFSKVIIKFLNQGMWETKTLGIKR